MQNHKLFRRCFIMLLVVAACTGIYGVPSLASAPVQPPTGGTKMPVPSTPAPGTGSQEPGTPETNVATAPELVVTKLASQERTVTLTVDIKEHSQATSGKIKIHYPAQMLRVLSAQGGRLWDVEDVNPNLTESGQNVISYAWADTEMLASSGNLLTVVWEAQDAANGQEVIVETEIAELYAQEQPLAVRTDVMIDRLRPYFRTSSQYQSQSSAVRTGDDANPAGYVLLCLGSMLVMVNLVRQRHSL